MASRRAGNHRGRKGKNGVYSPKHNDRNTKEQPEHINPDKIADNKIVLYGREQADITIDAHEQQVYEELLSDALERHNARQIRNRHKNLCMTMEQARKNEKWCPEETVFTLSNADNPINPDLLWAVHQDYINWHLQQYPQCRLLDSAMHVDEANPHIHDRWLWLAQETDANGNRYNIVNQSRALEQMGVERPDLSKKTGRHNNAKMTYTADCRQHQIAFARSHGLEIVEEPRDPSKSGLSQEKYILQKIREDQEMLIEQNDAISGEIATKLNQIDYLDQIIAERQDQLSAYDANIADHQDRQIRHMELYKEMTQESAQYREFMAQIARNREGGKER